MSNRKRRYFDEEFKIQLVQRFLKNNEQKAVIIKEYELSYKVFNGWIKKYSPQVKYNYQELYAQLKTIEAENYKLRQELEVYKTAFLKLTELNNN